MFCNVEQEPLLHQRLGETFSSPVVWLRVYRAETCVRGRLTARAFIYSTNMQQREAT